MSAYRTAIDLTTKTIDTRSKYFRNLVVTVVTLSLISIVWAAVTRTPSPLSGLLLLLPACGFFFYLDGKLLQDWRSSLMQAWVKKDIDFNALQEAVNAVPMIPKNTLRGMLATLPSAHDLTSEQKVSSSTREAVAAAVAGIHACQSDVIALKTAAAAIVSALVIIAAAFRAWQPMLSGVALILLPILRKWLKKRRIAAMKQRTLAAQVKPDFSREKYGEFAERLQWHPISKSEKDRLLKSGLPN